MCLQRVSVNGLLIMDARKHLDMRGHPNLKYSLPERLRLRPRAHKGSRITGCPISAPAAVLLHPVPKQVDVAPHVPAMHCPHIATQAQGCSEQSLVDTSTGSHVTPGPSEKYFGCTPPLDCW